MGHMDRISREAIVIEQHPVILIREDDFCPTLPPTTFSLAPPWSLLFGAAQSLRHYVLIGFFFHTSSAATLCNPLSPSSSLQPWRWRQHASPKRWLLPTNPHGALTQKNIIRIVTAVQTLISYVTSCITTGNQLTRQITTNFVEQSSSWEASSRLLGQDISHLLWKPKYHCRVERSLSLYLSCQMDLVRTLQPSFLKIHSNIILLSTCMCSEWSHPFGLANRIL
jgi:hypothetical protein